MPRGHIDMLPAALCAATTIDVADCPRKLRGIMDEFGFCVISNVLSAQDVAACRQLFCEDLRAIVALNDEAFTNTPLARAMVTSGKDIAGAWQHPTHATGRMNPSFASDYGLAQGKGAWFCRRHSNVQGVFRVLFPGEELCCGTDVVFFDNVPMDQEEEEKDDGVREDNLWPHADQSIFVEDSGKWECFQSIVYLTDATSETSSTVMWPGSHKGPYDEMMERKAPAHHYASLPLAMYGAFQAGAGRVPLARGSMLLWNSKTIHQGWNLGPRLAFPLCFEPKARRSSEALESKRMCVLRGYPTTHWASLGLPHGVASVAPGGTKAFPLRTLANRWAFTGDPEGEDGAVIPELDALL
jgi:ectoine hydroxylase-related dioxygenase (phytanoyl-CoA dioxygenase family)